MFGLCVPAPQTQPAGPSTAVTASGTTQSEEDRINQVIREREAALMAESKYKREGALMASTNLLI